MLKIHEAIARLSHDVEAKYGVKRGIKSIKFTRETTKCLTDDLFNISVTPTLTITSAFMVYNEFNYLGIKIKGTRENIMDRMNPKQYFQLVVEFLCEQHPELSLNEIKVKAEKLLKVKEEDL